ncbi:hypothetical protein BN946_scf184868.g14 [Trametes cinnabarina]|uniref:Uncharacterized protein n=1 Tax=Pycnoporus cinnabarinus TaxID=5643 RepID=A0A060SQE0_PYCCI|nr:hypothetical protein BN946_scf184868.g14 [Trametes cinnabarina]
MRMRVLTRQQICIPCVTFTLGLTALGGTLATVFQTHSVKLSSPIHCTTDAPGPIFVPIPLMLSDIVVIIVTWNRTFKVARLARDLVQRPTLTYVMLESGILYFIILFVVNLLQLILQLLQVTTTQSASFVSASVLICHFVLSLRSVNEQQDADVSFLISTQHTYPIFASVDADGSFALDPWRSDFI